MLRGHAQLGIGVDHGIDVVLHLVIVIIIEIDRALIGAITILVDKDDAIGEGEILRIGGGTAGLGIGMEVLGATELC